MYIYIYTLHVMPYAPQNRWLPWVLTTRLKEMFCGNRSPLSSVMLLCCCGLLNGKCQVFMTHLRDLSTQIISLNLLEMPTKKTAGRIVICFKCISPTPTHPCTVWLLLIGES